MFGGLYPVFSRGISEHGISYTLGVGIFGCLVYTPLYSLREHVTRSRAHHLLGGLGGCILRRRGSLWPCFVCMYVVCMCDDLVQRGYSAT